MPHPKIIICGSIAIDRIMNFAGEYKDMIQADKLHALSVSVLVDSFDQAEGGNGANMCHGLALLGEHPVLLGAAGKDAEGYLLRLKDEGVIDHVYRSDLPTASFNVLTDSAGNQVGGFYPGAMGDADSLTFGDKSQNPDDLFLIGAHDPAAMRRQVTECAERQLRLAYDPGQQVNNLPGEDLRAGVEAAEVVMVNDYELSLLCKKTGLAEAELVARIPVLVTTLGEKGSLIRGNSVPKPIAVGIARPARLIDPTGAGDAYRAGFFYGYLRQWDLTKCGQLGSVMASFALEQHGPQAQVSRQAVAGRYHNTYNEEVSF